ncbi:MAG TPA: STAS domain-containing protein [Verrucomicrobiae bacterium]
MSVAVVEQMAFVKLPGRANFTTSVEFKTLINGLRDQGVNHFVLDLGECVTMDSTFLGVLAGLALRNSEGKETAANGEKLKLDLLNPNARVADLLDNLGVVHLFNVLQQDNPCTAMFEPVTNEHPAPSKEEMSRNCLEAHELLMRINPENVPKFKEVTKFLAEDLRRMQEQGK